jgi:hypothetical protein
MSTGCFARLRTLSTDSQSGQVSKSTVFVEIDVSMQLSEENVSSKAIIPMESLS